MMDREAHGASHWDGADASTLEAVWDSDGAGAAPLFWPDAPRPGPAPSQTQTAVLVLGMHRSGTSALTRLLALHGASLPARLEAANATNITGHWESRAIRAFNDELLMALGSHWADWRAIAGDGARGLACGGWGARGAALLRAEFGAAPLYVLKDPRHCRLAGFWLAVLAAQGVQARVLVPLRAPAEVAASLAARDGFSPAYGLLLWLGHVLDAERASRGQRRLFTTYDALLADGRGLAARVGAGLGLTLETAPPGEVEAFVDPSLRRHWAEGDPASGWVSEVYAILRRWAEGAEDTADHARLDAIAAAFAAAEPCFAGLVADGRAEPAETAQLRGRLAALGGAMAVEAARCAEESGALHARVYDEQCRVAAAERLAADLGAQLDEARGWVFRLAGERAGAAREAERLARAVAAAEQRAREEAGAVRRLEAALAAESAVRDAAVLEARAEADRAARIELAAARGVLREARAQHGAQAAALAERFDEIARLTALLQAGEDEVARLRAGAEACAQAEADSAARLEVAEAAHAGEACARGALEDELARAKSELGAAEAALAERFEEIAALARLLAQREAELRLMQGQAQWLRTVAGDLAGGLAKASVLWRWCPGALWWVRRRVLAGVRAAGLFDARYYLRAHRDVAAAGMDPLRHYILYGQGEGRCALPEPHDGGASA